MTLARPRDQLGHARGPDPASWRADRAAERLRVERVLDQGEVGERVADLGALVEPERAEHAVRDAVVRERALQRLGRVPGPGEREDLGRRGAGGERVGDLGGHPVRLGELVREAPHPHPAAGAAHRDQRLRRRAARCGSRTGRAASRISARERKFRPSTISRVTGVALAEAEDVPGVGVAPAVDQLVVVAAHAQVPVRAGEQVDEHRLRVAGVLELVGQDPPPPLPQPREPVRML